MLTKLALLLTIEPRESIARRLARTTILSFDDAMSLLETFGTEQAVRVGLAAMVFTLPTPRVVGVPFTLGPAPQ